MAMHDDKAPNLEPSLNILGDSPLKGLAKNQLLDALRRNSHMTPADGIRYLRERLQGMLPTACAMRVIESAVSEVFHIHLGVKRQKGNQGDH